jgi:hypothetical protein
MCDSIGWKHTIPALIGEDQTSRRSSSREGAPQAALIKTLNPKIRGWTQYYRACVAKKVFNRMDAQLYRKLYRWARFRNPRKSAGWRFEVTQLEISLLNQKENFETLV